MTILGQIKQVKAELKVISAAFCISLLAGAAFYSLRPSKYEVYMLTESRLSTIGPYSSNLPWTVKQTVDSGILSIEVAKKTGVTEIALPRFGATVCSSNQLVKIYTFVPLKEIETTKKCMLTLFDVLSEKFPKANEQYFLEMGGLVKDASELDWRLHKIASMVKAAGLMQEFPGLSGVILKMQKKAVHLQAEGSSLHVFGLKIIVPPMAAAEPAGPTLPQTLLSFGLLGFFAGLSTALWRRRTSGRDI